MQFDESPVERTMSLEAYTGADDTGPLRLSAQDHAAVDALAPGSALLIVQQGPNTGARFLLDQDITSAGRSVAADIFLDDVTVSREHAVFVRHENHFVLQDRGSLNGTYINKELVTEKVLRPGDEVQIGKYRLTFYPAP